MRFVYDDGGRAAAGFKGHTGDCVCRAVSIASQRPYAEVYAILAEGMGNQRKTKHYRKKRATARRGVTVKRMWFLDYMHDLGFQWIPTMQIGSGCKVHLAEGELPAGRLVVSVSKHYVAVIDGVIHDLSNPSRAETRCVYGYWKKQ